MKKKIKIFLYLVIIFLIIYLLMLPSEESAYEKVGKELHFDTSDCEIIKSEDSHGGFHGDGETYIIFNCQNSPLKLSDWKDLPLSPNLTKMLNKEQEISKVEEGYYYFVNTFNRYYNNGIDIHDESSLSLNNYLIAIYDTKNNFLYYYKFDS